MAVVAALELHHVFSLGVGAGQADRRHCRFCPRIDEADFLHVRKGCYHQLREIRFRGSRSAKARTVPRCGRDPSTTSGGASPKISGPQDRELIYSLPSVPCNEDLGLALKIHRLPADRAESPYRRIYPPGISCSARVFAMPGSFVFSGHQSPPCASSTIAAANSLEIHNLAMVLKYATGTVFPVSPSNREGLGTASGAPGCP